MLLEIWFILQLGVAYMEIPVSTQLTKTIPRYYQFPPTAQVN